MELAPKIESPEAVAKFEATRGELKLGLEKVGALQNLSAEAQATLRAAGIEFLTAAGFTEYKKRPQQEEAAA